MFNCLYIFVFQFNKNISTFRAPTVVFSFHSPPLLAHRSIVVGHDISSIYVIVVYLMSSCVNWAFFSISG
jgi:hypothetical protein